ncbi:MAG: histone deacetylase family protein [Pseudomonadota bacterium]
MKTYFVTHPVFEQHEVPRGHPEHPGRIRSVWAAIQSLVNDGTVERKDAPRAKREQLLAVHTEDYVEQVYRMAPVDTLVELDHETTMGPHSLEAAERAAGAVCLAVDALIEGDTRRAFCAVRPPGHHARSHSVAGFCIFNNVAVGAAQALTHADVSRLAIVDFDVHHGDGTEEIFRERSDVLMCSTYQHPLYPDVNLPSIPGSQINVPLPAGADSAAFRQAVTESWLPELHRFQPDLVMISAGFDAHRNDPLGGLQLDAADFAWATSQMVAIAERYADGRVLAVLEGGYDVSALAECSHAVVSALELNSL